MSTLTSEPASHSTSLDERLQVILDQMFEFYQSAEGDSSPDHESIQALAWRILQMIERLALLVKASAMDSNLTPFDFEKAAMRSFEDLAKGGAGAEHEMISRFASACTDGGSIARIALNASRSLRKQLSKSDAVAMFEERFAPLLKANAYASYSGFVCARIVGPTARGDAEVEYRVLCQSRLGQCYRVAGDGVGTRLEVWLQPERPTAEAAVAAQISEEGGETMDEVEFEFFVEARGVRFRPRRDKVRLDPKQPSPVSWFEVLELSQKSNVPVVIWVEVVHKGLNRHVQTLKVELETGATAPENSPVDLPAKAALVRLPARTGGKGKADA